MATTDFWHPTPRSMSLTRLVVMRPRSRGAPRARSPATTGVSRGWVHELVKRYDAEGEAGLVPRSRRQRTSPQRKPEALAYEVVQLRKHLAKQGLDAGAVTIVYDLAHPVPPGFVALQPQTPQGLLRALRSGRCPTSAGRPT